ncbi:DUF550 domain-containing protein [Mangrovibacter phragmitis]
MYMARALLQAIEQKPVEYKVVSPFGDVTLRDQECEARMYQGMPMWKVTPLYSGPVVSEQTAREHVRREHAEWSQATFGNVGPVGPLKHLSKEALEAAAEPGDLSEWADMQFLLWDAQRRAGITDEQIVQAMIKKLAVNKTRNWPEPKDGEPRLHIKGGESRLLADERALFDAWLATDYEPDRSGMTTESDETAFIAILWHVWQARAALAGSS